MTGRQPLLSICIPTWNRADLLDFCLATVLPQSEVLHSEVEVIVCDNASTDHTQDILSSYSSRYSFRAFRNDQNIGIIGNITRCASEFASGQFVWSVGDDDALCQGAIERLLNLLRSPDAPPLIALNVGYLPRAERPPKTDAIGGVTAHTTKLLRSGTTSGVVDFPDLFEGPTADLTASYSVVLSRQMWLQEFPSTCEDPPFSTVRTTYPHAFTIARHMKHQRAAILNVPAVIVYEMPGDEFSWARYRAINGLVRATQLLNLYAAAGVPQHKLRPYFRYQLNHRSAELGDLMWNQESVGGISDVLTYFFLMKRHPILLARSLLAACDHRDAPTIISSTARVLRTAGRRCRSLMLGLK